MRNILSQSQCMRSLLKACTICLVLALCASMGACGLGGGAATLSPADQQLYDSATSGEFANFQAEVFRLVNEERARAGQPALRSAPVLTVVAIRRADELTRTFSHTRPNGRSWESMLAEYRVSWSTCGENVAMGQTDPADVMRSWMNSSGHRANILNGNFKYLGVGVSRNSAGRLCWSQNFVTFR